MLVASSHPDTREWKVPVEAVTYCPMLAGSTAAKILRLRARNKTLEPLARVFVSNGRFLAEVFYTEPTGRESLLFPVPWYLRENDIAGASER